MRIHLATHLSAIVMCSTIVSKHYPGSSLWYGLFLSHSPFIDSADDSRLGHGQQSSSRKTFYPKSFQFTGKDMDIIRHAG